MAQETPFQQAKQQIMNMMNMGNQVTDEDQVSIQHALQAAYEEATAEEKQELEQLEQQLKDNQ